MMRKKKEVPIPVIEIVEKPKRKRRTKLEIAADLKADSNISDEAEIGDALKFDNHDGTFEEGIINSIAEEGNGIIWAVKKNKRLFRAFKDRLKQSEDKKYWVTDY